jgi:hypothetical protein
MHMSGMEQRKRKAEPNDSETCHSAIDLPQLFSSSVGKVGIYNTTLDLHLHPFLSAIFNMSSSTVLRPSVQLNCSSRSLPMAEMTVHRYTSRYL